LQAIPKQLLLAQTESYVEYSRDGRIIKGAEKPIIRSRYEEDVLLNNHTTVWGSYFENGKWGYKCCKAFIKNSWCCKQSTADIEDEQPSTSGHAKEGKEMSPKKVESEKESSSSSSDSSSSSEDEEEKRKSKKRDRKRKKKKKQKDKRRKERAEKDKLQLAIEAEEKRIREFDDIMATDERKRKYNSMYENKVPTEEEMEAFMMKRPREDDPMAQFVSKKK
jgi:pre-mRNA-processing factor SLU7